MDASAALAPLRKKMQERSHLLIQGQIIGIGIQILEIKLSTRALDSEGRISVTAKEIGLRSGLRNRLPAIVSAMRRMEEARGWSITGQNSQTTLFLETDVPVPNQRPLESVRFKNKSFPLPSRSASVLMLSTIHPEGSSNALHYVGESLIDGNFEHRFYPALNTLVPANLRANPSDSQSMTNLLEHLGITCADLVEEMQLRTGGLSSCQNSDLLRGKCEAFDFSYRTAELHRFLASEAHNIRFIAFAWGPLEHLSGALRQELQDFKAALRFACPQIVWIENELPAFDATKMADELLGQRMREVFQLENTNALDEGQVVQSSFRVTLQRTYRDLGFINVPLRVTQEDPMLFPLDLERFDYEVILNGSQSGRSESGEGMVQRPAGPSSNVRLALSSRFVHTLNEANVPEMTPLSIHVMRKPGERLTLTMTIGMQGSSMA